MREFANTEMRDARKSIVTNDHKVGELAEPANVTGG
jgi:hypothetical protein